VIFDCVAEVGHERLVDAFVDDDVRKDTNKLKRQAGYKQTIGRSAEVVDTQTNHSDKEDDQSEVFKKRIHI
jgi:hypothetical protein